MSTCREKIKRSSAVILSRNTCRKIGSNVFGKKEKRPCPETLKHNKSSMAALT